MIMTQKSKNKKVHNISALLQTREHRMTVCGRVCERERDKREARNGKRRKFLIRN